MEWLWRGGRVAECTGFENRRGETHRGFESLPLRHDLYPIKWTRNVDPLFLLLELIINKRM